jgi:hypothetical protein
MEVSPMGAFPTKTMADLFAAASDRWTRRTTGQPMPDFYNWCVTSGLLGTGAGQFKPVSADQDATTDPEFANGASVTFVDGSMAVRDLDELRHGRPAQWRALAPLPEEILRRFEADSP